MDRQEKAGPTQHSRYANKSEAGVHDTGALASAVERENNHGAEPGSLANDEVNRPPGARSRSEVTGKHDSGSGANETVDGLDSETEAVRRQAENIPTGKEPRDEPVFDRGEDAPKM